MVFKRDGSIVSTDSATPFDFTWTRKLDRSSHVCCNTMEFHRRNGNQRSLYYSKC